MKACPSNAASAPANNGATRYSQDASSVSRCTSTPCFPLRVLASVHKNLLMPISPQQFELLLPLAAFWAREQEAHILARGVPLRESAFGEAALQLAARARLRNPQRVRLLRVETIPEPHNATLARAARASGLITSHAAGLTLGHGIFLRAETWHSSQLLLHELTHVRQYEERGIESFLREYLWQCLSVGYENAPLEREAIEAAQRPVT